jgi:hypothetical protein
MHVIPIAYDSIYRNLKVEGLTEHFMTVKDTWITSDNRFRVYITQLVTGGTLRTCAWLLHLPWFVLKTMP